MIHRVAPDSMEMGHTGLDQYGGFLSEEFLPELRGSRGRQVYREMRDNDPTIGAVMFAIEMLIRQVDWDVDPGDAVIGAASVDLGGDADFLWQTMNDMDRPWIDFIAETLTKLTFGWSLFEIVNKLRHGALGRYKSRYMDGRVGWAKLAPRAQETIDEWVFADNGDTLAAVQQGAPSYLRVEIPLDRCLLFRPGSSKGNPEGRSCLRNAYRPWLFKKHIEEIEGIGVERDLAGYPVMEVPLEMMYDTASAEDKALLGLLKQVVTRIKRGTQEGALIPQQRDDKGNKLYDLRLLSSAGSRQMDTTAIINRYDARIAATMLADFVMLGHETVGSFALASSKTALFAVALGAWLDSICEVLNTHAVPRLFAANNHPWGAPLPRIVHGDIESRDLGELGTYLGQLAAAGMPLFPDPVLERYCLRAAKLERSEDEGGALEDLQWMIAK